MNSVRRTGAWLNLCTTIRVKAPATIANPWVWRERRSTSIPRAARSNPNAPVVRIVTRKAVTIRVICHPIFRDNCHLVPSKASKEAIGAQSGEDSQNQAKGGNEWPMSACNSAIICQVARQLTMVPVAWLIQECEPSEESFFAYRVARIADRAL